MWFLLRFYCFPYCNGQVWCTYFFHFFLIFFLLLAARFTFFCVIVHLRVAIEFCVRDSLAWDTDFSYSLFAIRIEWLTKTKFIQNRIGRDIWRTKSMFSVHLVENTKCALTNLIRLQINFIDIFCRAFCFGFFFYFSLLFNSSLCVINNSNGNF